MSTDTLYNVDNYGKFLQTVESMGGQCFIGLKGNYFGVGGGIGVFNQFAQS